MTSEAPRLPVPSWDREWEGRFEAELEALRRAGTRYEIDHGRLAEGALEMELDWVGPPLPLRLRAVFPESFPWTRPTVSIEDTSTELPSRHCSPMDGQLCLLGRDTRQWNPLWTLQELLDRQLAAALEGGGEEDPQAEPMEVWWNGFAAEETGYCLVDSAWDPGSAGEGRLTLAYSYGHGLLPAFRACAAAASKPGFSARFDPPLPLPRTATIPWLHLDSPFAPRRDRNVLAELIAGHPSLSRSPAIPLDGSRHGRLFALSYPMEVERGRNGAGWLFAFVPGKHLLSRSGRAMDVRILQTLRAGPADLRARDPGAAVLAGKRVVVVGAGAIGAPIVLGLARGGVARLDVVDHDRVEPGNAVRWVAGVPAWGLGKAETLKAMIEEHHPACRVVAHRSAIGAPGPDVAPILADADLVVDATAAYGPGLWLGSTCKALGVPLLAAMAWADGAVEGGAVALHAPAGGCPHCLQFAQHGGEVPSFGDPSAEPRLQPPGCAERTFLGSGDDLQEVALQALRMVPAALAEPSSSVVATLRFVTGPLGIRSPRWRTMGFTSSERCGCSTRSA